MKKLSSIFIAIAVFCFVAFTSCQGSGSSEPATEPQEEMVDDAATEVIEEEVDSSATEEMAGEAEMTEESHEAH